MNLNTQGSFQRGFLKGLARVFTAISVLALVACGKPGLNTNDLGSSAEMIIGGKPVPVEDAMTKSTVFLTNGTYKDAFCSAVLIGPQFVLTAAHCLDGESKIFVGFGDGKISPKALLIKAKVFKIHPEYQHSSINGYNDLGVIILETPAPATYQPIKFLPEEVPVAKGLELIIAGYGLTETSQDMQEQLLATDGVSVSVLENKNEYRVDESNGHGSCNGDSGGPTFSIIGDQKYLVGITSRGDNACKKYGIYTIARNYLDWMRSFSVKYPEAAF